MHHLPGTLKNCHFELGETKEHVFQTGPSQWLVSAPQTFSSVIQCEKSHDTIHQTTLINHCQPSMQALSLSQIACHSTRHQTKINIQDSPSLMVMGQ